MPAPETAKQLLVRDYMTPHLYTLAPDARLLDAVLMIRSQNIRHVPVVSDGKLVGLLTERDVNRFAPSILRSSQEEYNEVFEQTLLRTVMTKNLTTVTPDTPLAEAVTLMLQNKLGCLPVVDAADKDSLVGILAITDVLRFASDALAGAIKI